MKTCPVCGQSIPDPRGPKRVCVCCGKPIRRRDRWHFGPRGPEHNNCLDPAPGAYEPVPQRLLEVVNG